MLCIIRRMLFLKGYEEAQLVEALRYTPEVQGFGS